METRIIATLMIKNEEKIIRRCIDRILQSGAVHAISISDTGSTDTTLQILADFLPTIATTIPSHVATHTWSDFGTNRTLALRAAQSLCKDLGWSPEHTYGLLLDADMKYEQVEPFPPLNAAGYRLQQKSGSLEYYNTRLVRLDVPWKCVGVTHEYWDGAETVSIPPTIAFIDDVGDGGCKSDKFERDERLLRKGLLDEPTNVRYMFYLAQTLKDLKRLPESIELYKQRVAGGGWFEEVWYSMYQISRLYGDLGNLTEMEYWGLKAYDFNPRRSENLYYLTRIFREKSQHFKAWHYMLLGAAIPKPSELLFLEKDVYSHLFEYERSILSYYVNPNRAEGLTTLVKYYNQQGGHCYSNLQFYVERSPAIRTTKLLPFQPVGDFVPTSTSFVRTANNKYCLNVRYVNYRIQPNGSYLMMKNGVLSGSEPVKTRNFMVITDDSFVPYSPMEEMTLSPAAALAIPMSHHIQGVEDLRLFSANPNPKHQNWIGTCVLNESKGIRQVVGTYDTANKKLTDVTVLPSPFGPAHSCEKNWIPIAGSGAGGPSVIYSWHPFRILDLSTNSFSFVSDTTPKLFEHVRGSSNLVEFNGSLYAIVHVVQYTQPRKYYHMVVRLSQSSVPTGYTLPFYFNKNAIEYVLALDITPDGRLKTIVSQNDADPLFVEMDLSALAFLGV